MDFAQFIVFVSLYVSLVKSDENVNIEQYTTELINIHLLPNDYNRNIRPKYGEQPVQMNISLRINDISSISETSMDFNVDFFIRHRWNDHRLNFSVNHSITEITLEESFAKKIWLPDTFFVNSKTLDIHKTVVSKETTLLRIAANGDITYTTKIYMTAQCPMDLSYFPIDQQKCSIKLGSSGKTTKEVNYNWINDSTAVEFDSDIFLPTFRLVGFNKRAKVAHSTAGNFTHLHLDIFIARNIDFYVARVYIPASLMVFISWIPFWLDRNDHHARVALGVTTILTMTTLITNTFSYLPKVSYLSALDVYLFFCFILVFLSLIEFATVGYYDAKKDKFEHENGNSISQNDQLKHFESKHIFIKKT